MLLSATSLFAALILLSVVPAASVAAGPSDTPAWVARVEGRIVRHADLNDDGAAEVFVAIPGTCDEDGRCLLTVMQPRGRGGFRVLLPATEMWDLAPATGTASNGWQDLVEASRQGAAMDDITLVRWRFDGRVYLREEHTRSALPSTPSWISGLAEGDRGGEGGMLDFGETAGGNPFPGSRIE